MSIGIKMVFPELALGILTNLLYDSSNKVIDSIFENEPIEKAVIRKTDFKTIIKDQIDLEEFPDISDKDIKVICDFLYKSKDIKLIIKQLYVFQSDANKSLEEIREDFISLFPETIEVKNGDTILAAEEKFSFLLKVFEVLDEGVQIALNKAADEGSLGALKALSNRRHLDMKNELKSEFKDIKNLIKGGFRESEEFTVPIEKLPSLFISYAREDDEPFVEKLYQDLTARGFVIWWDRTAIKNRGRSFLQEIRDAIENSDLLIGVIGPKAIESDSVRYEWEHALLFSKGVIPILRIGDYALLPPEMSKLHCPDFREDCPYEKALQELIRLLKEPIPPLGKIIAVPSLPPNYLPRKEDLKKVNELILADTAKPVVITSAKQITALQGMGGMGKSVLSAAFARTTETRRAFYDGVFWVTVGLDPDPSENMRLVGTKLGDDPVNYSSKNEAEASLSKVLSDKVCLIILDDVWEVQHITPFINALGSRCRLLITTRNGDIVTSLEAQEHEIKVLSKTEALKLLADWCKQEVNSLPSEASAVAEKCGYLPLALSVCGAMAKSGIPWLDILEALKEADLEFIEANLPNYQNSSIMKALKVSIDFLFNENPGAVLRYQELATFPADEFIPEAAIVTLWAHTGNLKKRDVRKLLAKLKDRSLLSLDGEAPNRLVSLHDLQFDYLRATLNNLPRLHNQLLEAYGKECGNIWIAGPNDGYFYGHLAYHMKEAGRKEELQRLLLDFEWMSTKLKKVNLIQDKIGVEKPDVNSLINDYDYLPDDKEAQLVQNAIKLSFNAIVQDRNQLAGQLLGRLLCFHEEGIQSLLSQACKIRDSIRLLPMTSSLTPPRGPLLRTLEGHESWVLAVVVTSDGKYVVSASHDRTIKVWDLEKLEEKITLKGHKASVKAVVVTPDGKYAVSTSYDRTIKVWDLKTGEEKATVEKHSDEMFAIAVTPNGKYVVSTSKDSTLKVWELETGKKKATLKDYYGTHIVLTPDGKYVISASYGRKVELWSLETGKKEAVFEGHEDTVSAVAVTPNGKCAVSGSSNGTLKIWDLEKGKERATLKGHEDRVNAVAVTPDGKYAVSGSSDKTLKIWDLEKGDERATLKGHEKNVEAVAVTPDGKYVVSGSMDRTIKVWDLEKGKEKIAALKENEDPANAVSITPDGKYLISVLDSKTMLVCDSKTGEEKATLKGNTDSVSTVAVTPDNKYLIAVSCDEDREDYELLEVWYTEKGKTDLIFERSVYYTSWTAVAITPNGKYAIAALYGGTITIWDLEKGKEKTTLNGHKASVEVLEVTPDGKYLISASWDNTIKVWDLEKGNEKVTLKGHRNVVHALKVTPDGKHLISASDDRTIKFWDLEKGEAICSFTGDSSFKTCNISLDKEFIIVGDALDRVHFLRFDKSN